MLAWRLTSLFRNKLIEIKNHIGHHGPCGEFLGIEPLIRWRFADRDDCGDLKDELVVCGAPRVPQVVFLSEDDHPVGRYGDRTLWKYRSMAAALDGSASKYSNVPSGDALLSAVVQEWLNEFERVQLILRTSARLRQKHGD